MGLLLGGGQRHRARPPIGLNTAPIVPARRAARHRHRTMPVRRRTIFHCFPRRGSSSLFVGCADEMVPAHSCAAEPDLLIPPLAAPSSTSRLTAGLAVIHDPRRRNHSTSRLTMLGRVVFFSTSTAYSSYAPRASRASQRIERPTPSHRAETQPSSPATATAPVRASPGAADAPPESGSRPQQDPTCPAPRPSSSMDAASSANGV